MEQFVVALVVSITLFTLYTKEINMVLDMRIGEEPSRTVNNSKVFENTSNNL